MAGEVFIVTAEQQTIKLPLVEVHAVSADEMRRSIESVKKELLEQEVQFTPLATSIENLAAKAKSKREEAETGFTDPDSPEYYHHVDNYERVLRYSSGCQRLQSKAEGFSYYLKSGAPFFRALPKPIASAKTNSEGRFEIKLLNSKPIILCATASRKTIDSWEFYYWMVQVEPRSSGKIDLSSDNLATSGSPDSVIQVLTSRWNQSDSPVTYASLESFRSELSKLENESVAIASALSNIKTESSSPAVPKTGAEPEKKTVVLPIPAPEVSVTPEATAATLTKPIEVSLKYGSAKLPTGMKLPIVSRNGSTLIIEYSGEKLEIPVDSTDVR